MDGLRVVVGGLFRGSYFSGRRSFDIGLFAVFIGVGQELVDNASALLLLDPSLLRFLLFSKKLVIHFPAHDVLHS